MSEERSEAPTQKRRQESRQRGQVARSQEVNLVAGLAVSLLVLHWYGPAFVAGLLDLMRGNFLALDTAEVTLDGLGGLATGQHFLGLGLLAPILAASLLAALVANLAQIGFLITGQTLRPDLSRLSPLGGLKRLVAKRSLVEFGKSLAHLVVLSVITGLVAQDKILLLLQTGPADPAALAGILVASLNELALKLTVALVPLAILDYFFQRRDLLGKLRMTKQEIKQEFKESEGDPLLRSHLRQRQRQIATGRMMQSVPRADVIVTNPTHYAVALAYDPSQMASPLVLAKGQNLIAERIKEIARLHGVPVVENKPVAQMLYKTVGVGGEIPAGLYRAVAEILAYIYQTRPRQTPRPALGVASPGVQR